jgi:glutathione peroxidase
MSIYEMDVLDRDGKEVFLKDYKGKVVLIINSATICGFTPQYERLENLYEQYKEQGFIILDFPCNQFGHQAPGTNEEIAAFCESKYGVSFPIFSKIDVNGEEASPLYKYLVKEKGFGGFNPEHELSAHLDEKLSKENPNYKNEPSIKWNFTKFLIDREGKVIERFEPMEDLNLVEEKVKELL